MALPSKGAGLRPSPLTAAECRTALPAGARGLGGFAPIITKGGEKMSTSNRAILSFYTTTGDIMRLSIPRARANKPAAEVRTTMEDIIALNVVFTKEGFPVEVRGAEFVTTTRTPVLTPQELDELLA